MTEHLYNELRKAYTVSLQPLFWWYEIKSLPLRCNIIISIMTISSNMSPVRDKVSQGQTECQTVTCLI